MDAARQSWSLPAMASRISTAQYAPWRPACAEYFKSYTDGRYDEGAQLWFIAPHAETRIDEARDAFMIGRAGADGIEFCFRKGFAGVWAYYPNENEFQLKAATLAHLERGWKDGSVWV